MAFNLDALLGAGITLVVVGVGLAFGLSVMTSVRSGFTANTLEYNATTSAMTGVSNVTAQLPILGTIVVAVIIIGLLIAGFSYATRS